MIIRIAVGQKLETGETEMHHNADETVIYFYYIFIIL